MISAELYPDIIDAGGLTIALQQALVRNGSRLVVNGFSRSPSSAYAHVQMDVRSSQVFITLNERLFSFDIWRDGVNYGHGQTPDLNELAFTINRWIQECCSVSEIAQARCIRLRKYARAFDDGTEIEDRWSSYLSNEKDRFQLAPFLELASKNTILRGLFPYTSLSTLCFSRCTGYPYSTDCPCVTPIGKGEFIVSKRGVGDLGTGDAEFALNLVLTNLPEDCGPAVRGTADTLNFR